MEKDYRLGQIFRRWGESYIAKWQPAGVVCRTLRAIASCRTQVLGGIEVLCKSCGCVHRVYASCGNRNCPICPALKKEIWLMKRQEALLPVKYYHVVFTLPSELDILCKNHPRILYNILFRSAWQSLKMMLEDGKWCGARSGMLSILHTWGQNLSFHPHLHCIVPAGGLSFDQQSWVGAKKSKVLVDVMELSKLFRVTFMNQLRTYWEFKGIDFRGSARRYEDIEVWRALFASVDKAWVVHTSSPDCGAHQTLNYLSRYTHAVAISEYRILEVGEQSVQIQYKDYADEAENGLPKKKTMELKGMDFIQRFVQHILPKGFQKIRYYGIWAPCNGQRYLKKCQQLLKQVVYKQSLQAIKALVKQKMGVVSGCCKYCQSQTIVTKVLVQNPIKGLYKANQLRISRSPPKIVRSQHLLHF